MTRRHVRATLLTHAAPVLVVLLAVCWTVAMFVVAAGGAE
jgi:hypothetical protein